MILIFFFRLTYTKALYRIDIKQVGNCFDYKNMLIL